MEKRKDSKDSAINNDKSQRPSEPLVPKDKSNSDFMQKNEIPNLDKSFFSVAGRSKKNSLFAQ